MTIRSTPNNGGFQLSHVPFVSYYWFCLIKSSFIITLRLRYQTFKNKPKHTGINSDIINKRSMGNLAYTTLRFLCLVWKRAGPIVKAWAIPMVRFGPTFPLFSPYKPALWAFLFCWLSFSFSRREVRVVSCSLCDPTQANLVFIYSFASIAHFVLLTECEEQA